MKKGFGVRVVSMASWELFEAQPKEYRENVLPWIVTRRLAVEAGSPFGWERYTGIRGKIIAMDGFGASAPAGDLFKKFGFTVENVIKEAESLQVDK
jgi:transketolase